MKIKECVKKKNNQWRDQDLLWSGIIVMRVFYVGKYKGESLIWPRKTWARIE